MARLLPAPESRSALAELVPRLAGDIARAHGLTSEADYAAEYPVTVKDADEAAFAGETVAAVFGAGHGEVAQARAGSGDRADQPLRGRGLPRRGPG